MRKSVCLLLSVILCFALIACDDADNSHVDQVKTPAASSKMSGQHYEDVIKIFEDHGFTNIKTEKIDDLIFGWLTKDGEVEDVSVGGDVDYDPDEWVPADIEVIIRYHVFSEDSEETDKIKETETTDLTDSDTQSVDITETEKPGENTTEAEIPEDTSETESPEEITSSLECDHSYIGKIVTEATCDLNGVKTFTCEKCEDSYDEEIESAGHKYNDATCTSPKTCDVCGKTDGKAAGHKYNDATCTSPKTCGICGKTNGNALGHAYLKGFCERCKAADPGYVETQTLKLIYITESVNNNDYATVKIQGKPNTSYLIEVYYSSGASTAEGLESKISDSEGIVTWTWKVGARTKEGDHRIVIRGGGETIETSFYTYK